MNSTVEKLRALRAQLDAATAALRADQDLSPLGRRRQLEAIYEDARARRRDLIEQDERDRAKAVEAASKDLFTGGIGVLADRATEIVVERDAADRASAARSASEAAQLLNRALDRGDESMARALIRHCWEHAGSPLGGAWDAVIDQYAERRPDRAPAIQALVNAQRHGLAGLSAEDKIMATTLPPPAELSGRAPAAETATAG